MAIHRAIKAARALATAPEDLSESERVQRFAAWLDAQPFSVESQAALHRSPADKGYAVDHCDPLSRPQPLLLALRRLLGDQATGTFAALLPTYREPLQTFVDWLLLVTRYDVRFFTTTHTGWVSNAFGRGYHHGLALLARDVDTAARVVGLTVRDDLAVPDMPYLSTNLGAASLTIGTGLSDRGLGHLDEPTGRSRGVYVLLSYINDWEAGEWHSSVPGSSVFTNGAQARKAFRRYHAALTAQADEEIEKVQQGAKEGYFELTGGFNVVLLLYKVPLSDRNPDDPTQWALQDDHDEYLLADSSYSFEYASGGEGDVRRRDVDLTDYLPPPLSLTRRSE
jgi:hypothetical protein